MPILAAARAVVLQAKLFRHRVDNFPFRAGKSPPKKSYPPTKRRWRERVGTTPPSGPPWGLAGRPSIRGNPGRDGCRPNCSPPRWRWWKWRIKFRFLGGPVLFLRASRIFAWRDSRNWRRGTVLEETGLAICETIWSITAPLKKSRREIDWTNELSAADIYKKNNKINRHQRQSNDAVYGI